MAANLAELIRAAAASRPKHVGLVDGEERITWQEAAERANAVAAHLVKLGIKRGDRVAIYTEHGLGQAIAIFGTAMAGGVFTSVNPVLKLAQVEHQIGDADARVIVGTARHLTVLGEFISNRNTAILEIDAFGVVQGEQLVDLAPVRVDTIPADVACLIYTSGSTGKPKGVIVPHRTLLDGGRIVSGYLGIGEDDVTCSILPLGFDYGLNQLITATTQAARVVFHRYMLPNDLLTILSREQVTGFAAVPTLWPKLLHERFAANKPPLPHLRYVTTAGGAHSQTLLRQLSDFFAGVDIIVMYGLTESFRSCYLPFSEIFRRPGSIGRAVPEVEILVLDEEGRDCLPGQVGELYHRGAFVNYGYLNAPGLTEAKYVERAVFGPGCRPDIIVRSGDLVHRDDDGFLYFHGRVDTQIKTMGFRVSPAEIEEIALSFPGILEPAVVGVPDEQAGEAIVLFYTAARSGAVDEMSLKSHLATALPSYAMPRAIIELEAIPQTATGKIDYQMLKSKWLGDR